MSEEQTCTTNTTEQGHPSRTEPLTEQEIREARLALLRAPFPPNQINKLPKPTCPMDEWRKLEKGRCEECGGWHPKTKTIHLDYVGHAALTDRLLESDPYWTWEPMALNEMGLPRVDSNGGMWIKLTVCGVTRLGYGDAQGKTGANAVKEQIGDALRNAAMRFGAALDLWHKGTLNIEETPRQEYPDESQVDHSKMEQIFSQAVDIANSEDMENGPTNAVELWDKLNNNEKIFINEKLKKIKVKGPSGRDKALSSIFGEYVTLGRKAAEMVDMGL